METASTGPGKAVEHKKALAWRSGLFCAQGLLKLGEPFAHGLGIVGRRVTCAWLTGLNVVVEPDETADDALLIVPLLELVLHIAWRSPRLAVGAIFAPQARPHERGPVEAAAHRLVEGLNPVLGVVVAASGVALQVQAQHQAGRLGIERLEAICPV